MAMFGADSDLINSVYSGIVRNSVFRWPMLPVFIAMVAFLFAINYGGLYSVLNVSVGNSFRVGYTSTYPPYVIPYALALVALEFFLFFYLLSLGLEIKKRTENKSRIKFGEAIVAAASKYPRFLVASVFQLFVFLGGLIVFVVPGLYLGTRMIFFSVLNHGQDFTFMDALKESTDAVKNSFITGLLLILIYLAVVAAPLYIVSMLDVSLVLKVLLLSIFISFASISFLSSSDSLYYRVKSHVTYKRPPFMIRSIGVPG